MLMEERLKNVQAVRDVQSSNCSSALNILPTATPSRFSPDLKNKAHFGFSSKNTYKCEPQNEKEQQANK